MFAFDESYNKELECAICLNPFEDPLELKPCGHVFCRTCIVSSLHQVALTSCPDCRGSIAGREAPNPLIARLLMKLPGFCRVCGWKGTRFDFEQHRQRCKPGSQKTAVPQGGAVPGAIPPMAMEAFEADPWEGYDMTQSEYEEIVRAFRLIAQPSSILSFGLMETAARYLNLPHTPRDVRAAFEMFQLPLTGVLNEHQFCLWSRSHRRHPMQEYGLSAETYAQVLEQFHNVDQQHQGYVAPDRVQEIVAAVVGHIPTGDEMSDIMAPLQRRFPSNNIDLHFLLVVLRSQMDGWVVCEAPAAPPASRAPPHNRYTRRVP